MMVELVQVRNSKLPHVKEPTWLCARGRSFNRLYLVISFVRFYQLLSTSRFWQPSNDLSEGRQHITKHPESVRPIAFTIFGIQGGQLQTGRCPKWGITKSQYQMPVTV
jgi:hypothetical protein